MLESSSSSIPDCNGASLFFFAFPPAFFLFSFCSWLLETSSSLLCVIKLNCKANPVLTIVNVAEEQRRGKNQCIILFHNFYPSKNGLKIKMHYGFVSLLKKVRSKRFSHQRVASPGSEFHIFSIYCGSLCMPELKPWHKINRNTECKTNQKKMTQEMA